MEFVFQLILELCGEILVQIIFEALTAAGLHLLRSSDREVVPGSTWKVALGYSLLGGIAGGLSLLHFPHSLMHTTHGRVACLVLAPVVSGLAMAIIGGWRRRRGQPVLGIDGFAYGYVFAFAMALVRFICAR